MQYEIVEPFGEFRQELRHGQLMAMLANINRDVKKRPEGYSAREFMNYLDDPEEKSSEESPEERLAKQKAFFKGKAHG